MQDVRFAVRMLSKAPSFTQAALLISSLLGLVPTSPLFVAFGLIAGILATAGVYGLRVYLATQRRREIGIRITVGVIQVLRQSEMLYQVDALDPLVFTGAPLVLASAIGAASYIPVRRALRMDPTVVLRPE